MAQQIGDRLGSYEIVAPLGAGGMGEVYRARDTKLGREVAIKVLPEALSQDKERLARFEREAKLLASLNHPGIATLYGLEEDAGQPFLVMELVEGETLAEQIARGPLSVEVALPLFQQIAEALEAAHEKAVIHRDLKPANIKVTPEGKVKVLDFGLAKAFAPQESEVDDSSQSPTLTKGTALGAIMGTASYMSPEQARGKPVDKRTDIWAFGSCLYEALTGKKAFEGETVTDTISAVVRAEPDWKPLSKHPQRVRRLLARCLQKDSRGRLRDIGDARIELRDVLAEPSSESPALARPRHTVTLLAALAAALATGLVAWIIWGSSKPIPSSVTRFTVVLPPSRNIGPGARYVDVALSPDGRALVYRANNQLFLRRMDDVDAVPLAGTESPSSAGPVFSPDGEWIAYRDRRQLRKVLTRGGAPITICPVDGFGGADWRKDDSIVFADQHGLWMVSADGGEPERILASEEKRFNFPHWLPGDDWLLFTSMNLGDLQSAETVALSLETGEQKSLLRGVTGARYIETGHLLFVDERQQLVATAFDRQRAEIRGGRVPLIEGVSVSTVTAAAQFAVSDTGVLAYLGSGRSTLNRPAWVERDGSATPLPFEGSPYGDVRLSPDGGSVAIQDVVSGVDLWIYEMDRGSLTRLSHDPRTDETPVWSPDGRYVAYASASATGATGRRVLRKAADGSGQDEELWKTKDHTHVTDWLPDGSGLILDAARQGTREDILLLEFSSEPAVKPLLATPFGERLARLSPDGKWLAYVSDEAGQDEIYVQPFPGLDARHTISTGGGTQPVWSNDGRELYYRGPSDLMTVTIASSEPFRASAPEALFEDDFSLGQRNHTSYDVAPDGRFLMLMRLQTASVDDPFRGLDYFHVVLNWFEELNRLVPTDN